MKQRLVKAYGQLRIGNPLDEHNHVGPLIDSLAVQAYNKAIEAVRQEGEHFWWKAAFSRTGNTNQVAM